ncbi:ASCH domain-containing protein [Candidatus Bathyarchaeota archaeon]|nr:ASCH domain-containing protein [Candidatus Bathyarchaeota archaeon]RLG94821.1 MAG: ASCH domain-containing protein [Candidatus Bathyarchaeota archaeon]
MKQLNFKKEYKERLLSGRKLTTIRMNTNLKPRDLVEIVAGGESCGYARIKSIVRKRISEISNKDARRDGFKNKKELLRALKKIYGRITPETKVYIIRFEKEDL